MKRIFLGIIMLTFFVLSCINENSKQIKVGLIAPITGEGATYGASMMRGA